MGSGTIPSVALSEWAAIVGEAHLLVGEAAAEYRINVSGLERSVLGALRPASTEEVRRIVGVANAHRCPLYPFSRGGNWGLGSRLPPSPAMLVDLSRMQRIIDVDAKHGVAVIEPGVTQGQLHQYLQENRLPFILDVTGSGLSTSILGNALERGVGYFACRVEGLCGMEVVLGNGTVIQTGFSHVEQAKCKYLYPHGIGPSLDGLFAQSNYGIVTRAGVTLLPKKDDALAVVIRANRDLPIGTFIDALGDLRRSGALETVIHVAHRDRGEITFAPILVEFLRQRRPASPEALRAEALRILRIEQSAEWTAVCGLISATDLLAARQRMIRRRMRGIGSVHFMGERQLRIAKAITGLFSRIDFFFRKLAMLNALEPFLGLTQGRPTDAALNSVVWPINQSLDSANANPDLTHAGMLYVLPFVPLAGDDVEALLAIVRRIFDKSGFTPYITLNLVSERAIDCVVNLAFDRSDARSTDDAHACIASVTAACVAAGYLPYRVGVQSMSAILDDADPFWQTVRDLKQVLDPNGIIAPGRYNLI